MHTVCFLTVHVCVCNARTRWCDLKEGISTRAQAGTCKQAREHPGYNAGACQMQQRFRGHEGGQATQARRGNACKERKQARGKIPLARRILDNSDPRGLRHSPPDEKHERINTCISQLNVLHERIHSCASDTRARMHSSDTTTHIHAPLDVFDKQCVHPFVS